MSKKLNQQFKSTHFVVDEKGVLKFLTVCPKLNSKDAEYYLLAQSIRMYNEFGVWGALEYFRYRF